MFQLLLIGGNILKLWWDGGVLVWLALARPSKALTASKSEKVIKFEKTVSIWQSQYHEENYEENIWGKNMRKNYEEKSPLSLAVESASRLGSAEGELGGAEVVFSV